MQYNWQLLLWDLLVIQLFQHLAFCLFSFSHCLLSIANLAKQVTIDFVDVREPIVIGHHLLPHVIVGVVVPILVVQCFSPLLYFCQLLLIEDNLPLVDLFHTLLSTLLSYAIALIVITL